MTLNWRSGFTRIWLVLSVLWWAFIASLVFVPAIWDMPPPPQGFWGWFFVGINGPGWLWMFGPPIALLLVIRALGWIFAGFSSRNSN